MLVTDSGQSYPVAHWEIADRAEFDNPERDAARALEVRDRSLLGVTRFAIFVPGVDGDYELLRTKYIIKIIPRTSDVNVGGSYNKIAEQYALTYNRHILKKLGCSSKKPMNKCTAYP
jgi:hypothetical protein